MGRGKLALELILKEKSRKVKFEKWKKGLMKTAHEFSILCGSEMCMIIYSDRASEPEKVRRIIDRYRSEGPDRWLKWTTGLLDFPYSPSPANFQFSPLGSRSSMSFPEPTFNFLSNMAFAENVGQCDGIPMPIQMQMPAQMPPISHQQMAPRIWFSGATVDQQTMVVQAPSAAVSYTGESQQISAR